MCVTLCDPSAAFAAHHQDTIVPIVIDQGGRPDVIDRIVWGCVDHGEAACNAILLAITGTVLLFLFHMVDYAREERVQFEDDEYYYYLKAVPKMSVRAPAVTIKRFTRTEPVEEGKTPEEIVSEGISELNEDVFLAEFEDEFIKNKRGQ